jgi:hypothetical protein
MNVSQRITNILNYYQENPGCDPNMYEFVGLCYDMVQYLDREAPNYGIHSSGQILGEKGEVIREVISKEQRRAQYPIPCAVYDKFDILSQQFKQKLLGNDLGITEDSPLYQLYHDLSIGVGTYSAYGDTPLKEKLGGVALFIAQKKRDVAKGLIEDFTYDNRAEMEEIQRLNQELHDPQAGGYYTGPVGETDISKMTYVEAKPSPRQLLLEEIMNEYQKGLKVR